MGTFATTTSLQTLLPGVSFDTSTNALCSMCIAWAEGRARSSLSKRYDMSASPFNTSTSIPTHLTSITEKIAMGYYFKNSSRGAKEALTRGQSLIDEGVKELTDIAEYKADLIDNSLTSITNKISSSVLCSTSSYNKTINEDDPLKWKVDRNKLSDIASDRSSE